MIYYNSYMKLKKQKDQHLSLISQERNCYYFKYEKPNRQ